MDYSVESRIITGTTPDVTPASSPEGGIPEQDRQIEANVGEWN